MEKPFMKCKICRGYATIQLPHYNMNLCENHFVDFVEKRVKIAIEKYRMFTKKDKILVAFSGGKDSVSLWYILTKLGYSADAVYVKLGTNDQIAPILDILQDLSKKLQRPYTVVDATQYFYGLTVFNVARILRRPTCSFCGKVKRYFMNKVAVENNYDVLVTGHNIDDEASLLLGNMLHWQTDYILRTYPVLEKTHSKFVKKAKPHVLNYEIDIKNYVDVMGLRYLHSTCPFSIGATLPVYKKLLDELEKLQPNAKVTFYKGFLRERERIFKKTEKHSELNSCEVCGYPTPGKICAVCAARQLLEKRLDDRGRIDIRQM